MKQSIGFVLYLTYGPAAFRRLCVETKYQTGLTYVV